MYAFNMLVTVSNSTMLEKMLEESLVDKLEVSKRASYREIHSVLKKKGEIRIDRFTMFRYDTWLSPSNLSGQRCL